MRGHEKLIELRVSGFTPRFVFVNDYPCKTDWFDFGDQPTVCTHADPIHSLDFRFMVGISVSISASSEQRAKALFEKAKAAGAALVASAEIQDNKHRREQTGWVGIYTKKESENG